jgi:mRNA-degrading endonuclease toxin of MazEF toxin-antitoxin module
MKHGQVSRGDIYEINMEGMEDERKAKRYCIVVSNNIANRYTDKVTIVPLSTSVKDTSNIPTLVTMRHNGVNACIRPELIKTVNQRRLREWGGRVSAEVMSNIEQAMMMQLGMAPIKKTGGGHVAVHN